MGVLRWELCCCWDVALMPPTQSGKMWKMTMHRSPACSTRGRGSGWLVAWAGFAAVAWAGVAAVAWACVAPRASGSRLQITSAYLWLDAVWGCAARALRCAHLTR